MTRKHFALTDHSRLTPRLAAVLVLVCYVMFEPAYAYVDPGTGAMFLQLAAAALAGVAFYFRSFRSRLVSFFRRQRGDVAASEDGGGRPTDA